MLLQAILLKEIVPFSEFEGHTDAEAAESVLASLGYPVGPPPDDSTWNPPEN